MFLKKIVRPLSVFILVIFLVTPFQTYAQKRGKGKIYHIPQSNHKFQKVKRKGFRALHPIPRQKNAAPTIHFGPGPSG